MSAFRNRNFFRSNANTSSASTASTTTSISGTAEQSWRRSGALSAFSPLSSPVSPVPLNRYSLVLDCPVCADPFVTRENADPLILECGHSVCENCAEKMLTSDHETISCSVCSRITNGDHILSNMDLSEQIDMVLKASLATKPPQCSSCCEKEANTVCFSCPKDLRNLCSSCCEYVHKMNSFRHHTTEVWSLGTDLKSRKLRALKCKVHPSYREDVVCMEQYCEGNGKLTCLMCKEFGPHHISHKVELVSVVAAEKRKEVEKKCGILKREEFSVAEAIILLTQLEYEIAGLDEADETVKDEEDKENVQSEGDVPKPKKKKYGFKKKIRAKLAQVLDQIEAHFEELIRSLKRRKEELKEMVKAMAADKLFCLKKQKAQLREFLTRAYAVLYVAEEAMKMDDQRFVCQVQSVLDQVEDVLTHQARTTNPLTTSNLNVAFDDSLIHQCDNHGQVEPFHKNSTLSQLDAIQFSSLQTARKAAPVIVQSFGGVAAALRSTPPTTSRVFGSKGAGEGQFQNPWRVSVDRDGLIVVSEYSGNRIQVFDENGKFKFQFGSPGNGDGQFSVPSATVDPFSGRIYVSDSGNDRIQVFDGVGNFLYKFGVKGSEEGQLASPRSVAIDTERRVVVLDGGNQRVQIFNEKGDFLFKFGSGGYGDGQFSNPWCVAVDSKHRIIVADYSNHRIQVFDEYGNFLFKFGSKGSQDGQFSSPIAVCVDSLGQIVVSEHSNHRVQVFSDDGTFLWKYGSLGSGEDQFSYPYGVAVDNKGRLLVAEYGNHRIQILE